MKSSIWYRLAASGLVALMAFSLTLLAFVQMRSADRERVRAEFSNQAEKQVVAIEHELQQNVERIQGLADTIRVVHPQFAAEQFERYADLMLTRQPTLFWLCWTEWVADDEREAVLQAIQEDGYAVRELVSVGPDGEAMRAPERDHYLVVRHVAPEAFGGMFVGLDLMSSPDRRETIERAIETGELAATGALELATSPEGGPGVLLFVPIYATTEVPATEEDRRENFRGAVTFGFRIALSHGRHLTDSLSWARQPSFRTVVYDTDRRGRRHILYDSHAPEEGGPVDLQQLKQHPLATEDWVEVGGQRWEIVSAPAEGFELAWRRARAPWVALGLGTTVSLLLMVLTAMYLRDYARTRAFADERAATAAELEQTNARLQETNEEMEKFVSAVSHDLKNPLVGIQWLSRSARGAADQRDVQAMHRAVDGLDQAAQTMRRIIDDLLSHSRAGYAAFNEELVDVDALVREILANHASEMERRGMHAQVDTPLPTIRGDRARLTAMFENLIANAWKYGVPSDSSRPPEVHIGCEATPTSNLQPPTARFYVRDNGPGVPEEARDRVFGMFERFSTDDEGTGLGLAIVARAAKTHGGRAWIESSPGGGATFWVEVAVAPEDAADGLTVCDPQPPRDKPRP